jgi:hypothetical protein
MIAAHSSDIAAKEGAMKEKKRWIRPQLILLSRARLGENVLLSCKGLAAAGPQRPAGWSCMHPGHGPCSSQGNS